MFGNFIAFLRFELGYWLKSMMVYVFLTIMTFLIFVFLVQDSGPVEAVFNRAQHNSAFAIQLVYGMTSVFGCLMVTAFVNAAASRDFAYGTQQLLFTKPIHKLSYLSGRFVGAFLVSMIPMLGGSLAVILAEQFNSGPNWGPPQWQAHFWSIAVIALPNTFIIAAIVFTIAIWTRSALASFLGVLGFIVAIVIASALTTGLDNTLLATLIDPFAEEAIRQTTRYWTLEDKNTRSIGFEGYILWNRLLWIAIGFVVLAAGYLRFSFTTDEGLIRKWFRIAKESLVQPFLAPYHTAQLPHVQRFFGSTALVRKWAHLTRTEIGQTLRSPIFICMLVGVLLVTSTNFSVRTSQMFGVTTLPVTFNMVELVLGSLMQFQLAVITFYTGVFVWKERDAKLDEIYDALPIPTGLTYLAKFSAMLVVVASMMLLGVVCAMIYQGFHGIRPEVSTYAEELFGWHFVSLFCLVVLAFFCHVISPNKYVGYFLFVGLFVANSIAWSLFGVASNMFEFGDLPNHVYSDLFGTSPYRSILAWFSAYWLSFALLIVFASVLLWRRGKESGFQRRLAQVPHRWKGSLRFGSLLTIAVWGLTASWVFYNTWVVNEIQSEDQLKQVQADYEDQWKSKADQPQPRVVKVRYDIDLFPYQRRLVMKGDQVIENRNEVPVSDIYLVVNDQFEVSVEIEGATETDRDEELNVWTFHLETPMQPGEQRRMQFELQYEPNGFENSLGMPSIVQNGSFFNNSIAPQIGYQNRYEISDPDDREEYGLEGLSFTELDPDDMKARGTTYISNNSDWVDVETVISTASDQVAVAPGSLEEVWSENDRKYFRYQLDHKSLNFYSFVSAKFKVQTRQLGDVDLEVYYHPDHEWNVDKMLDSMRTSLDYYSKNFGPYRHKQARIVEFPRVATFAQAFPGTMPYSEGIGFIADLSDPENDIDMVYYVVAHEMAHQWWAHQVIGANMRGATVLSETLAQYSALMVMEQKYGRDMMRKFLEYEMDNYLRARGRASRAELPLKEVEFDQGYIHYNKGSLAMYLLRETIGEDKVNEALRSLVDKFAYQGPPYPTSLDLVEALRKVTPEEHQTVIDDVFDHITLFDNRTESASYRKLGKNQYEVTLEVSFRKLHADDRGQETEVELNDWIEIGAFGKTAGKNRFGETLYRERFKINQERQEFTFVVDKEPALVGVDPISLLIDRNKDDNMQAPTKEE